MHEYITDDIEISSDDSDREHSDEKTLIKEILIKKMLMKKIKYRMCLFLYWKHFEWFLVIHKRLIKTTLNDTIESLNRILLILWQLSLLWV